MVTGKAVDGGTSRGGFWQALGRWAASSEEERDAQTLREQAEESGCAKLMDLEDRARARVRGIVHTVTLQPRAGTPALEVELFDGSDVVTLVWLGQRRIGGIDVGRRMIVMGRVTTLDGRRVMFNPRYELLPEGVE
jgi:hypothetical protein